MSDKRRKTEFERMFPALSKQREPLTATADCFLHGPYDPKLWDCPHPDHKRKNAQSVTQEER